VQFIPLTFRPEKKTDLEETEETNNLESGDIIKARWIKPTVRRKATQTCGHVILSLSSARAANKVLANGLFICQKKVYPKKCKKEPIHCLKFHGWNHIASECTRELDLCGTCAHNHCTSECTNQINLHCTPCESDGHASWDRGCPTFQHKCNKMNERTEDNQLPYFLTHEPWMQAKEPPKAIFIIQPPRPRTKDGNRAQGRYTQTTLTYQSSAPNPGGSTRPPQRGPHQPWNSQTDCDRPPHESQMNE
jgi:hypothetical protein